MDGFDSPLYWFFLVLVLHNALAIPLALPQICLNFSSGLPRRRLPGRISGSDSIKSWIAPEDAKTRRRARLEPRNWNDRVIVLIIWAACCYGIQVLFERQRRTEAEATELAVRQERLRTAGRLAAEIAHKIKNPLGIITNAAFCLQRAVNDGEFAVEEQVNIIREEVSRADQILDRADGLLPIGRGPRRAPRSGRRN